LPQQPGPAAWVAEEPAVAERQASRHAQVVVPLAWAVVVRSASRPSRAEVRQV
jgi:hypothetical protein